MAAVSTSDGRHLRKIKLLPVKGFRKDEIRKLMDEHLARTSRLVTDGQRRWTAATEAGLADRATVTCSGKQAAQWSSFKSANTTLGNVKAPVTGTYGRISPDNAYRLARRLGLALHAPFPAQPA